MKLNLGCGYAKAAGYLNVDLFPECEPDLVYDLESLPWPWADNSVEHIAMIHCLEHLGRDPRTFLGIIKEIYRVCRNGARVEIHVPHPRHDDFISDPTHVRVVTQDVMWLFSRKACDEWKRTGAANSRFAHYLDVDLEIVDSTNVLTDEYRARLKSGEITPEQVQAAAASQFNVIQEIRMTLAVNKD